MVGESFVVFFGNVTGRKKLRGRLLDQPGRGGLGHGKLFSRSSGGGSQR